MRTFIGGCTLFVAVMFAGLRCTPTATPPPDLEPIPVVTLPSTVPPTSVALAAIYEAIRQDSGQDSAPSTAEIPVALVDPDSPCQEWVPLAIAQGWPQDREVIERLVNIMWRESRCNAGAYNPDDPNTGSYGLLQVNGYWCLPSKYWAEGWLQAQGVLDECSKLYDPAVNLRAAWLMYSYSSQRNGGDGWNPWK
jgi:hypothetical protein